MRTKTDRKRTAIDFHLGGYDAAEPTTTKGRSENVVRWSILRKTKSKEIDRIMHDLLRST